MFDGFYAVSLPKKLHNSENSCTFACEIGCCTKDPCPCTEPCYKQQIKEYGKRIAYEEKQLKRRHT